MSLTPCKGVWHKCLLLNYPWVDTRPAKYLIAHTSLIGDHLLKLIGSENPVQALWDLWGNEPFDLNSVKDQAG